MKSFQKQTKIPPPKNPKTPYTQPGRVSKDFVPNNRQGRRAQGKQKRR